MLSRLIDVLSRLFQNPIFWSFFLGQMEQVAYINISLILISIFTYYYLFSKKNIRIYNTIRNITVPRQGTRELSMLYLTLLSKLPPVPLFQ